MARQFTAESPLLRVQNLLGEGCVWDTRSQRLYWVDIEQKRIYTYEPSSGIHGFETFDSKISSLALMEGGEGMVGTSETTFIMIPFTSLPFPPKNTTSPQHYISLAKGLLLSAREARFNDGFCDPAGRFVSGTMSSGGHGCRDGILYSIGTPENAHASPLERTYVPQQILDGITVTNGTGWTVKGDKMLFSDSWTRTIFGFDYDLKTGTLSNRTVFHQTDDDALGEPDGLCMDDQDGVWSARWQSGKIIRINPKGDIDVVINFPGAYNITCCCWGGQNLDELYVTTASNSMMNQPTESHPQGGDLFLVKNLGFKGFEKHRFRG